MKVFLDSSTIIFESRSLRNKIEEELPIKIEQTFSIEAEVKEMLETDEYLKTILDNVLLKIQETLELGDENYYINVSLEQDIEVPDWKDILVLLNYHSLKASGFLFPRELPDIGIGGLTFSPEA